MRKKLSLFDWRKVCVLFATMFLFGINAALADAGTPVDINSTNTIANQQTVYFTPPSNGYVLVEFGQTVDLLSPNGVFYDYASYGADYAQNAVACNGKEAGMQSTSGYGSFMGYTDVTKAVYEVTGGKPYCIWNTYQFDLKVTTSFSTTLPDLNGGGNGGGGNDGPTVNENDYTYQPSYNEVKEFGLGNVVISWPKGVDVTVLNENAIWIDNPDIAGNGLKAPNDLWIGHELEAAYDPSSPPLPNTLKIAFVNPSIVDMNTWTLLNPYPYEVSIAVNVPAGAIALNGVPTTEDIEINYTLPAGTQSFYIPEPNSTPQNNTYHMVSTIDKITLDWDNWYVGYGDNFNSYAAAARNVKIYISNNNEFPNLATSPYIEVSLAGQNFMQYTTRFGQQLVITPNEALNDPTKWYTLIIPAGTLSFKNDNDDLVDYNEDIELYYTVAGSTGTIVIPSQQQRIQSSQFKGLEIEGGDYTVVDASKIALYQGYYDETDTSVTTSTPIAYGVNQSTGDKIVIGFPSAGRFYSGAYTILVPQGAIDGFSVPKNQGGHSNPANQIQFAIEGNDAPISALKLSSDPQPGVVDEIESVRIWWADYTRIMHATNPGNSEGIGGSTTVNGTMSVNGGTPTNIVFNITKTLIQSAEDEDTGEADGVDYQYSLLYTPSSPITAPGKYTFTLPANSVRVYYNNFSEPLNDEVVLEYTIEGQVATGTDVTFNFTGVDNAYELITIIDENMNPIELEGSTVDYSFSSEDASLLVGINPIYNLTITGQGVEQSYDTFMVGDGDLMDEDMMVYPLTLYPGINGKTLVFTVSKEDTPESTANKLYVVTGPNMDEIEEANPATNPVLELQDNGTFKGSFEIEGMNAAFRFYSYVDGVYTYYSPESGGFAGNAWTSFANGTVTTNVLFETTSAKNSGSWRINGYPEGSVGGIVTAVVNLGSKRDEENDKVITDAVTTLSFEPTISGTPDLPEELLVVTDTGNFGSFSPTAVGGTVGTFQLSEDGTYEGDFTISNRTYFKFYALDNGAATYYSAFAGGTYPTLDFNLEDSFTYNTIVSGNAFGTGGWIAQPNTTIHAVVDLAKKTITLTKVEGQEGPGDGDEDYPENVYIVWARSAFSSFSPSASDQEMTNDEDGIFTASFEFSTNDTNKAFRLYSNEGGVITYITPRAGDGDWGQDDTVNFSSDLSKEYTNVLMTSTGDPGSWTIGAFPEGMTEGTIEISLDLTTKTFNITLVSEEADEPETVYIAFASHGSSITKNMLNPAADLQMELQQDGTYLFEYELSNETEDYFGFLMYTVEGSNYMSIGKQSGVGDWGEATGIELPVAGDSLEETFTNLKQYVVGTTTYDDQASFTFTNPGGFVSGNAMLKLSADLKTLEVFVTSEKGTEPEPEPEVEPINFTFSGVNNAFELVSAMNDEMQTITFHSGINEYMPLYDGEQLYFQVSDKYELTITNTAGLEEGYDTYFIGEPEAFNGFFMQTLTLYDGAQGTTFNIEVKEVETVTPAPVYMTGASVDPRDGSRFDNMGDVFITWGNYTLDINPEPNKDYVNLPLDKVTATLNGEKVNLNNMFGVIFRAINTQGSDEGTGGTSTFHVAEIQFYPGDLSFYWSGTLNLKFEEGLVKSTTGAISPAFDLTYYLGGKQVVSPAIFTPEEGAKFLPGEAVVYAAWAGYNVTAINGGVAVNALNEEGDISESINISNGQLSIEDGKLKIDLSSLPVGAYQMWVQQGAVDLGDNAINADAPYAFTIAEVEVPADPTESDIDPTITLDQEKNIITISYDGNDLEITDDWSLTITDSEGNVTNVPADKVSIDDKGNLVIDLSELGIEGGGDYTLTLGENSVLIDEDGTTTYNPELVYTFKTSAIAILTADGSKSWKVYNMNGVNVLNTDNAADLNQLEKGLYIINGKKVLVK